MESDNIKFYVMNVDDKFYVWLGGLGVRKFFVFLKICHRLLSVSSFVNQPIQFQLSGDLIDILNYII